MNWNALYARYQDIDRTRLAREQHQQAQLEARRAFQAWSERTTRAVMTAFFEKAAFQSVQFEQRTGARILIKYPTDSPLGATDVEGSRRVLVMHLHEARLHFHSYAGSTSLPHFYFMPTQAPRLGQNGGRRFRTLISIVACRAVPTQDDGYLLDVGPLMGEAPRPIDVDDLVFRAFFLLLEEFERVSAVKLPTPVSLHPLSM